MHTFDYSFLENGLLPVGLLNVTAFIYELRAMSWTLKEQFEDVFSKLEVIARVQSVKESNAIEGIITTDERIGEIVNGNSEPLNHSEQEIAGYRDALTAVHTGYADMDLRESDIRRLHMIMLSYTGATFAGEYKDYDNMEQLILAYQEARDNPNVNQLLLIPCAVMDFLCIHPFRDGNCRISRLLYVL